MRHIDIEYRHAQNGFRVWIWLDDDYHVFDIEPHEVPAVALTMMEIQLQEQDA